MQGCLSSLQPSMISPGVWSEISSLFPVLTSALGLWHLFLTHSLQPAGGLKSTQAPNLPSQTGRARFFVDEPADRFRRQGKHTTLSAHLLLHQETRVIECTASRLFFVREGPLIRTGASKSSN